MKGVVYMKKTVIITGATDGIGKALAMLLSKEYQLALCGRSEEKMRQLREELGDASVYAECFDITDGDQFHIVDMWRTTIFINKYQFML